MAHTLIQHKVDNFAKWKAAFDADEKFRVAAGEESWQIFRDEDYPDQVTVLTKFKSLQHAHEHLRSANFKETIKKAGVIGAPEIHFLKEAV